LADHPNPEVLNRWLEGRLAPGEVRSLVAHLLGGCASCQAVLAGRTFLFTEEEPPEALLLAADAPEDAYDLALRRAAERIRRHGVRALKIKRASARLHKRLIRRGSGGLSPERDEPVAAFEALLSRAWELRHENPQEMLHLSRLAVWTARRLKDLTSEDLADDQARALAELANALRVNEQLTLAEGSLESAERFFAAGTGSPEIGLRLKEVRASLLGVRGSSTAALALLDEIYRERLTLGDRPAALRTLVQRAVFSGDDGSYETALTLLDEAAGLALALGEDQLGLQITHNRINALIELNRGEEAQLLLQEHQATEALPRVDRIRLKGLEGRIHAQLGRLSLAEQAFREARSGFAGIGLRAHEALLSLDLAAVILRQGQDRSREAVGLAVEAVQVFSKLDLRDQVVESLMVLSEAVRQGHVTAELLQGIADFVRQAEHGRRTRQAPRSG
jgi:tetratricopeptide (TPR) repeat protein